MIVTIMDYLLTLLSIYDIVWNMMESSGLYYNISF